MLINEVSKITSLTKKAIEYYEQQNLISPSVSENGYRAFSETEVVCLKKVAVLRKLGLSIQQIKLVLLDQTKNTLQQLSVQKELTMQKEQQKKVILDQLSNGKTYEEVANDLEALEKNTTIAEKLLEAFPGYYGRFICLHFASFLNETILTNEQEKAYEEIIMFLDAAPCIDLPKDLQDYWEEHTRDITIEQISALDKSTKKSMENPNDFLTQNKEMLDEYLSYKQSDAYKNSPAYKISVLLNEFNQTNGYYDVFIPAMKRLSPAYATYSKQLEVANEVLLAQYPNLEK